MSPAAVQEGPTPPSITLWTIIRQFWADVYGKEVQSSNTYSYTWVADQAGHLFIGTVLVNLAQYVLAWFGVSQGLSLAFGLGLAVAGVATWEYSAYSSGVRAASNIFPLDKGLLAGNAVIATAYMTMGAIAGYGFHLQEPWNLYIFSAITLLAIACAPWWLRQKIIWQKAGLPYLFRLADVPAGTRIEGTSELQAFVDEPVPPLARPQQVIVGGPIGSGRTPVAAGIGTEFAFKNASVRYLGLHNLLEFAAEAPGSPFGDDPGPANINYWPWRTAQIVIIDDVGPFIGVPAEDDAANIERFKRLLNRLEPLAAALAKCHTVWVVGDLDPASNQASGPFLNDLAREIGKFCGATGQVLVVELSEPQTEPSATRPFRPFGFSARRALVRKIDL
jgi:hypothetical protein